MKKALVVCHMGRHYRKFGHYDIKTFQELGYEVHFAANFTLDIDRVDDDSIILHQIDFQRSPFSFKNICAYHQIKKLIANNNFELIHCQSPVGGVLTRLANKNLNHKCRILYTAHGFHFFKGAPLLNWMLFYPIEKYLAKYTDTLITINTEDFELAKKKFSKRCHDIQYVPGVGIDTKKFDFEMTKKEKHELRKSLGLKDDDFVVIFPARLDKNKNQGFLINCMEDLVKEHPNIHLLLPGSDELNGYYQKVSSDKGLDNNIHFLGFRKDIPQLMKISDIAVSSSLREGLPVNVIEAFACCLPVVAIRCRGMEDLIKQYENGFVVSNKKDFNDKILNLCNDENLLAKIKNNNVNKAESYSKAIIKSMLKKIIN